MNGVTPANYPDLFAAIILGTRRSPGVVTLSGHDRMKNWDIQAAKGQQGETSQLNGDKLGEFQASFYLTGDTDDERGSNDFIEWDSFQALIESTTSGPAPVALPIYHPDLVRNGFTEVVNAGIGGMIRDDRGGATVQVKFREHRPPKPKPPATAKVKPSSGTAKPGEPPPKPDPNADAKRELAGLLDEAKKP